MKITTLIPAYKTKYMQELLTGLATQTRASHRVIISDDSPNGEFSERLNSPEMAYLRARIPIELVEGPKTGAYQNLRHLIQLWDGSSELVHILLDDDVIYPDFYARHFNAQEAGTFPCSISARWTANERGQPIEGMPIPEGVFNSLNRLVTLDAGAMFVSTVPQCQNWFGEFSNCVFRSHVAELLFQHEFAGVSYAGLWDLGFFLAASIRGPIAYIQDRLGYFRTGGDGHSSQLFGKYMKAAHLGYVALALGGKKLGRLGEYHARLCYHGIAAALIQRYSQQEDMLPFCQLLPQMAAGEAGAEDRFEQLWASYLASNGF